MRPFLKPHVLAHQVCGCQVQVSIYVSEIEWTNTNLQYYSISILTIILHQPLNTIFKLWITLEIKILLMQAWRPFPGYRRLFSKALSQMSFSKVIALWSGINLNLDVSSDSLTESLTLLGRGRRESTIVIRTRCRQWTSQESEVGRTNTGRDVEFSDFTES